MMKLNVFKNKQKGLPDLLTYAALIDDGILLNKDGSLMTGWFYRGIDTESATETERNQLSHQINKVLVKLGTGWMSHIDIVRWQARDYPHVHESHFPDPITRLIDDERRAQFNTNRAHYESVYVWILTYLPPLHHHSQLTELVFSKKDQLKKTGLSSTVLEQFKTAILEIEDGLSCALTLQRLKSEVYRDAHGILHSNELLLQYLNYCITAENHAIHCPPCPMYMDSIMGGQEFYAGLTPKVATKFIQVVAINGFPQESFPGILSLLENLPIHYRWSTRFIYMDSTEALAHLKKFRRKWQQKIRGFVDQVFRTSKGIVDKDALEMVSDTDEAIAESASHLMAYGYYTSVVVLMDEDESLLIEQSRYIRRVIQQLGFDCRIETVNTTDAWLGSLPGHALPNLRRPLLNTLNLADLLPLSAIWPGEEYNPCPYYPAYSPSLFYAQTQGTTPFRVNLHVNDVGHTLIFGPTGSGKSTLLGLMIAQFFRYPNAQVFAFDKGNSLFALTHALKGEHHDIASESALHFCPFATLETDYDVAWAQEWVEQLIVLQGLKITPQHRNAIHQAMVLLRHGQSKTFTDFVTNLQDKALRDALQYYTVDGNLGMLLDNENDTLALSHFQTFEMESLMHLGDKALIPILLYLFYRIEKQLQGQPTLLILDEAWLMLGHAVFRDKIREWLKVLRKSNCAVVLATQSLSDATRSGIVDVLQESCPTKIFLPNPHATEESSSVFYRHLGLSQRQIEIIAQATPKRQYYYTSSLGKRLFELHLGPIALSFIGASSKDNIKDMKQLIADNAASWMWDWLVSRGIDIKTAGDP